MLKTSLEILDKLENLDNENDFIDKIVLLKNKINEQYLLTILENRDIIYIEKKRIKTGYYSRFHESREYENWYMYKFKNTKVIVNKELNIINNIYIIHLNIQFKNFLFENEETNAIFFGIVGDNNVIKF